MGGWPLLPRREASGETQPAGTLTLDFKPPELWEVDSVVET